MRSPHLLTAVFVGTTLIPGAILGWLGLQASARDAERLLDALQSESERQWNSVRTIAEAEHRRGRSELRIQLRETAGQLRAALPILPPGLALRHAEGQLPLRHGRVAVVRTNGTTVWPAHGPSPDPTRHVPESRRAQRALITAQATMYEQGPTAAAAELADRSATFSSSALRARLLARAGALWLKAGRIDQAEAVARRLLHVPPRDIANAGPAVLEFLADSSVGPDVLALLEQSGWLDAVPAPPSIRAQWLTTAAVGRGETLPIPSDVEHLVIDTPLEETLMMRCWLPTIALQERWLPRQSGPCAVDWSPEPMPVESGETATVLGTLHLDGQRWHARVRHPMSAVVAAEGRRRQWLTALGILALLSLMATGLWLVRRSLRREREARQLRDDFIANVSHELKTPLTSLQLHAEMLAEDDLESSTRERYAGVALAEGARLAALVEDLLDFSALERGQRSLDPTPTDLGRAVLALADAWQPVAASDRVDLTAETNADGEPAEALVDGVALARILANLVQNAWKHGRTPRHGAQRRVGLRAGPGPCLEVRDNGLGIPPQHREAVFERFRRGEDAATLPGAGIGLSLSRELARASGGDLVCDDDGEWTIFRLTLPPVPPPPPPTSESP